MATNKIAVIHWFPVEQYPPVTNLLADFAGNERWQVTAFTCRNDRGLAEYRHPSVTIFRSRFPSRSLRRIRRYAAYVVFPIAVFWRLLFLRPHTLLYVEPHSAMPAFLYCLFFRHCRLFIHYHEYHDAAEFLQPGMRLVRFYHWIEKHYLLRRAQWISQTNEDRRQFFQEDHPGIPESKLKVLPNYPPRSWTQAPQADWKSCLGEPLKLVYVGSISLHDTFIEPLVRWVCQHGNDVRLDIFSYNNDPKTHRFLADLNHPNIQFHSHGVAYDKLPQLLREFHVGLILYRGNTRNYVYNASNKLFEYLAIGLDVWYPPQMLGVQPYASLDTVPRVIETDFERLHELNLETRRDRSAVANSSEHYCCEDALQVMKDCIEVGTR